MAKENHNTEISPIVIGEKDIGSLVYRVRGQQVMLDSDLAEIYGYEVKYLNRQVKRNIDRFPDDFMFQLTKDEVEELRCQNVTANINPMSRTLPYVFSEQGIYMLATVLKSDIAVQQSIIIMRAFKNMRHYIQQNQQFVTKQEMRLLTDASQEENRKINERLDKTDEQIAAIHENINKINENFVLDTELRNYVIYKGQKFEADKAYIDIYKSAQKSIYVIDDYVNIKTLHLLSHKKNGVHVILFTENGFGHSREFLTNSEVTDFDKEYPTIQIKSNPDCHDRFIVLDYGTNTEKVYHCGASSKDAGRKVCAINAIENTLLIHPIIDNLLLNPDKVL